MKKLVLLLFTLAMFSCSKNDHDIEYPLLNTTWETTMTSESSKSTTTLFFRAKATGVIRVAIENIQNGSTFNVHNESEFDYELNRNNIYIEPYSNSMPVFTGTFTDNTMTLKSGSETFTFTKVK